MIISLLLLFTLLGVANIFFSLYNHPLNAAFLKRHYKLHGQNSNGETKTGLTLGLLKVAIKTAIVLVMIWLNANVMYVEFTIAMFLLPSLYELGDSIRHTLYLRYVIQNPGSLEGQLEGNAKLVKSSPFEPLSLLLPLLYVTLLINKAFIWGGLTGVTLSIFYNRLCRFKKIRNYISTHTH